MPFKFESPIKLHRFTSEEFRDIKRKYNEKYGYTVHVPGYTEIFKWDVIPEPTELELRYYKKKDVVRLGEARYLAIKHLMAKKKETFLRMMGSPSPNIITNIGSIMTTLDDINDALGTFAVVARIVARFLPAAAAKFITGPAGWALLGADIANIAMTLSRTALRPHTIQKELHDVVKNHPLSKKAKLCRANKLRRLALTKGELIEAMQTTENIFGVGLSLGPIVGLLLDIPAGLVRHVLGQKVVIKGLPAPFLWFDKIWLRVLKGAATLFSGLPKEMDQELTKTMVAVNLASQVSRTILPQYNPLDTIDDIPSLLVPAMKPEHPSTKSLLQDELGDFNLSYGWPFSSEPMIPATKIFNENLGLIIENLKQWRGRNNRNTEAMVGSQNLVEAGLHILGSLNLDDCVLIEYDPHTEVMLKLLNQGYRYPFYVEPEQVECFREHIEKHHDYYGETDYRDALLIAKDICCFEFVTRTPDGTEEAVDLDKLEALEISQDPKLKYLEDMIHVATVVADHGHTFTLNAIIYNLHRISAILNFFQENAWPPGHPTSHLCRIMEEALTICFHVLDIPIMQTICCRTHHLPRYIPDFLPSWIHLPPGFPFKVEDF